MDSEKEILVENITLTGLVDWLNNNEDFVKDGVKVKSHIFTSSDVQQYIKVGHLPYYLGGYAIVKVDNQYAKLYNVVEVE